MKNEGNESNKRLEVLTTLRGIAAWWVVLFHFREPLLPITPLWLNELLAKGYLAVDLFFILSGFIITSTYAEALEGRGLTPVINFIWRRIARIYPLHFFVLISYLSVPLAIWCCSNSSDTQNGYTAQYFIQSVFLVQNWGFSNSLDWNHPAWSISTELAAYLVFSVLAALSPIRNYSKNLIFFILFFLWLTLIILFLSNGYNSVGSAIPSLGLFRCVIQFFVGAALWLLIRRFIGNKFIPGLAILLLSLVSVTFCILFSIGDLYTVSPICCMIISALVLIPEKKLAFFTSPIPIRIGEISYSTYLIHDLIKQWVKFSVAEIQPNTVLIYIILVLIFSEICYRYIEHPSRVILNKFSLKIKQHDR